MMMPGKKGGFRRLADITALLEQATEGNPSAPAKQPPPKGGGVGLRLKVAGRG